MASTSAAMTATVTAEPVRQVPIRLTTSQNIIAVPDVPYLIPTTWRRTQLSTLVNRLVQEEQGTTQTTPFDFLIDGTLLRTSIDQYIESKGLTEETTLHVEYIRSTLPPKFSASFPHDDWLSSVDASRKDRFLTASYDGSVRVFSTSVTDKPLITLHAPNALTKACWIDDERVAASSLDGSLRISRITEDEQVHESVSYTHAFAEAKPLSSVSVNAKRDTLVTAAWDGSVAFWDAKTGSSSIIATTASDPDKPVAKKRKSSKGTSAATNDVQSLTPLSLVWHTAPTAGLATTDRLPGMNARVAGAVWTTDRNAVSAGWDGKVREWDVGQANAATVTKSSDKVILCIDAMHAGGTVDTVLTGHMDRSAAVWDLRLPATNISTAFVSAHAAPIGSIRAHPLHAHMFATGAYDGTMKLWDVRSPRVALFSITKPSVGAATKEDQQSKILAMDWDPSGQVLVAGGEDKQLSVFQGSGIGVNV